MTAIAAPTGPSRFQPPRHYANGAEWLHALGDVPLERVVFDPWPGTATEADLLRLVERDERLCELIDGTLVQKPVGLYESFIAVNLITCLNLFVRAQNLGAVSGPNGTLRMASGQIRLPDVCFIAAERLPKTREPVPTLAPDLAVEVVSETNTRLEMDQKLAEYFRSGTRLAWIIDPPTRSVEIYHAPDQPIRTLKEPEELDGEHVLPGLRMDVSDLFQNVPPI